MTHNPFSVGAMTRVSMSQLTTIRKHRERLHSRIRIAMPKKPVGCLGVDRERSRHTLLRFLRSGDSGTDPTDTGMLASWYSTSFDDSSWRILEGGKPWQEQGYPDYIGLRLVQKWIEYALKTRRSIFI